MRFLKGLFWVLLAVAIVAVAVYLTGQLALSDRLTNGYLVVQAWLPLTLAFEPAYRATIWSGAKLP